MNNKLKTVLIALLIVAVIVGAYFLYQSLSEDYGTPGQIPTPTPTVAPTAAPQQTDEDQDESTSTPAPTEETPSVVEAPDFTAYDEEGNAVKLSDYFGKPIVLNFWASWCGYCKQEMVGLQSLYEQYGEDVHFLLVNMCGFGNDTHEAAQQVIEEGNYTLPVLYDDDGEAMMTYGAYSLPATCFIDAEGNVVAAQMGYLSEEIIEGVIQDLI